MAMLFDLLVVVAILGFAYRGWLVGLETASVAALELVACLSVAVMLHEAVAGFLHAGFTMILGDWLAQAWSILIAFALLAWGSFALVRSQVHRKAEDDGKDEEAEIDPLADRLTGAVAGGIGGAVFAGGVFVTLSMVPFLAGLKPSGDRLFLDVGKTALRAAGQFAGERREGRSLPLWGEPPSRMSVATARLTSEPWFDVDDDGACTDKDRFRDVDGNGTFTKDLYYTDLDGDGVRRIGLIDKYVAGRWDGLLMSNERQRPDIVKPAPASPAKPAPPAAKPPASPDKPADSKPVDAKPAQGGKPPAEVTPDGAKPAGPRPADETATDGKPIEGKPADGKPSEGKPTPGKPANGKPAEGKPGEGKPGEGKPGEGKPGEGKPGEGKPGEGKPGEGKPGEGKPGGKPPAPGQKPPPPPPQDDF